MYCVVSLIKTGNTAEMLSAYNASVLPHVISREDGFHSEPERTDHSLMSWGVAAELEAPAEEAGNAQGTERQRY